MFQPVGRTWHGLTPSETADFLQTDVDAGLSALEAADRLNSIGPNTIAPPRGKGAILRFLEQFRQSLVLILIVAGVVTAVLGEWVDAGVIFGVVIINAIVGFLQEAKALQAIEALNKVMTTESMVVRDGVRSVLPAEQLIPGDLVILQSGDRVPADLRLTYSRDLQIDESALTGESLPVEKQTTPLEADALLANRSNMAYASTLCTRGQGAGLVVDTGDATEVGKISHLIAEARVLETPLTRKISQLSRVLLYVIIGLAVIAAVVGILRGEKIADMLVASVALAVGAIPEGLPAAVTIVLSIGVSRMARRRAIIRRLPAVETLGSTTVICSDKTGTLTENQMTVQKVVAAGRVYSVSGTGYAPEGSILEEGDGAAGTEGGVLSGEAVAADAEGTRHAPLLEVLRAGTLCNDSSLYWDEERWQVTGDPTEAALIASAAKAGFNREELERVLARQDTLPFESEYQYMATLHSTADGGRVIYVKGATERLLQRSSTMMAAAGARVSIEPAVIEAEAQKMASSGLRVLGFASKAVPVSTREITHEDVESDLIFLGLQGMIDPPRQEAIDAIGVCHGAGVQVKMITGDHALTAAAIAGRLRLGPLGCAPEPFPRVLTGGDLQAVEEADLQQVAEDTFVFARVTPEQKLRLVEALQNRGHVVAMTGDGVNDGPALRQADIGVAMGITGTEVAKEAADMVLTDDNFASIEAAVEEGRGVFDNLTKFITWTLPTNLAEGLVILVAILGGLLLPILPVQILWINMMTGIILGTSLAFEAKEKGIMSRAPRPARSPIIDRVLVGRIVLVGVMLVAGSFLLFEHAQNIGHSVAEARTVASNVIVFGELAFLFNCRSLTLPSWRVSVQKNWVLVGGALLMACMQMLYTYVPALNHLFGTAPLGVWTWVWIVGLAIGVHVVVETEKWIRRRRADKIAAASAC